MMNHCQSTARLLVLILLPQPLFCLFTANRHEALSFWHPTCTKILSCQRTSSSRPSRLTSLLSMGFVDACSSANSTASTSASMSTPTVEPHQLNEEFDSFSHCFLCDDDDDYDDHCSNATGPSPLLTEQDKTSPSNLALRYIPVVMPLLAYSTYENTAELFDNLVEIISNNNWVAVDGGAYQSSIITPAINGLVVPSMALLFATLMSNTINTLRQRQMQIRTSLNIEANDLRMISVMVDSMPSELRQTKNHLRKYLIQYATRVIAECKPGLSFKNQKLMGSIDCEINGFLRVLNTLGITQYSTMYVDTFLPAAEYTVEESRFHHIQTELGLSTQQRRTIAPFLPPYVFSEVYGALTRLRHERSVRLSALQSTYPPLHYAILALLGCSICGVFLMETNQELLIFLNAIQLKILWAMLIGTFSSLAVVNYDMIDPFRGSYNVGVSVNQFYTIREAIRSMVRIEQLQ
ncbi:hypothetical protein ACHAW6_008554 [Cyclotella cf. meneghiniana]